jgi:hypothetical protein
VTAGGGTTTAMTYTWNVGGTSSTTSVNSKTSQALTANTTYTVQIRNANGCVGAVSAPATITVNALPAVPTMSGGGSQCGGARSITATVGATGNGIRWYDDNSTEATRIVDKTGTYYALTTSAAGCVSAAWASVTVGIYPVPGLAQMSGGGTQCGGSVAITATPGTDGDGVRWYDDQSTEATRYVGVSGTYYALTTTAVGCVSASWASVAVTIRQAAGNGATADAVCGCATGLTNCSGTCRTSCCTNCTNWSQCSGFTEISNVSYEQGVSMIWSTADTYCKNKDMRLPTRTELECMCEHRATLPGGYSYVCYWASSATADMHYGVTMTSAGCTTYAGYDWNTNLVKCVR